MGVCHRHTHLHTHVCIHSHNHTHTQINKSFLKICLAELNVAAHPGSLRQEDLRFKVSLGYVRHSLKNKEIVRVLLLFAAL